VKNGLRRAIGRPIWVLYVWWWSVGLHKGWSSGWPLYFQEKHHVVLPNGCGAHSMVSWVSSGSIPSQCSINEGYKMIHALPHLFGWHKTSYGPSINSQVLGENVWMVGKRDPSASSSLYGWGLKNQCLVLKNPMAWKSMLHNGEDTRLSKLTPQVPLWPSRGLGSHIGMPSPRWRPICNPV